MASIGKPSHFGTAGEFFAMSELLLRGWNVAVPVVDTGDDVLIVDDNDKTTWRVQVKSAKADVGSGNVTAHFNLSRRQLKTGQQIELLYMLMIRHDARWRFLVIVRERLAELHALYTTTPRAGSGRPPKTDEAARVDNLGLRITLDGGRATAWEGLLSETLEEWPADLPELETGPGTRQYPR